MEGKLDNPDRPGTNAGNDLPSLASLFGRLEQVITAVLTLVIAVVAALSTWHLILLVVQLLLAGHLDPADHEVLQAIFGKFSPC